MCHKFIRVFLADDSTAFTDGAARRRGGLEVCSLMVFLTAW
jgi:hypothetical protein